MATNPEPYRSTGGAVERFDVVKVVQLLRPGAITRHQPAQTCGPGQAFGPVETLVEVLRTMGPRRGPRDFRQLATGADRVDQLHRRVGGQQARQPGISRLAQDAERQPSPTPRSHDAATRSRSS
jgi:hypothetical protein